MLVTRRKARSALVIAVVLVVAVATLVVGPWFMGAPQRAIGQPEIRVSYTFRLSDWIVGAAELPEGRAFLVLTLSVENRGYASFHADPFSDLFVRIGYYEYNVSAVSVLLPNHFSATNIGSGARADGEVVFQVPRGTTSFAPGWRTSEGLRIVFMSLPAT